MDTETLRYEYVGAIYSPTQSRNISAHTCLGCGALVMEPALDRHRVWHNVMAEALNEALGFD